MRTMAGTLSDKSPQDIGSRHDPTGTSPGSGADRSDPVIDVVLDPGPQPILVPLCPARLDLSLPAPHDLGVHGPQADTLVRHEAVPVLPHLRRDVGESHAHPPGQVFQRTEI